MKQFKKKIYKNIVVIFSIFLLPLTSLAYTPLPGSPLAKNEHPRIFVTPATLPAMAARATGSHSAMYNAIKARADDLLTGTISFHSGAYSCFIYDKTATLALVAMIEKQNGNAYAVYRDRAFVYAQYILDNTNPWDMTSLYQGWSFDIRGRSGTLSLVYDWLYSELEATLKANIHTFLVNVYKGLHNIDRPSGPGQVRRSVYGTAYWLEWGSHVWFSVVLYGDGQGDKALIDDALEATNAEVHDYQIPVLNILGGALHNGWGYQLGNGGMSFSLLNLLAWQTAAGEVVFNDTFALKDYPKYFLYARKPDNTLIKINDTYDTYCSIWINAVDHYNYAHGRQTLLPLLYTYKDGFSKYIVDLKDFSYAQYEQWRNLLFYENTVAAIEPSSTLEKVKFSPGTGMLFGRSDWESDALFYTFRNRDQFGNHSDAKQNSFTIFYKGSSLAINNGNYPPGAYSSPHTKDYYERTISSNSILVFDPSETFRIFNKDLYVDGGQKFGDDSLGASGYTGGYGNLNYTQESHDASEYNTADNQYETAQNYTWIKGDATRAYNKNKVTNFVREFIHLKPDYFLVFDRVSSTNKDFKKKWLLHSIGEPILNGIEDFTCAEDLQAGEAACQGDPNAGISKSYDSNLAKITNGNARLFCKTLLPNNPVIRKLGGEGYRFWVDNANQNLIPLYYQPSVTGGWRIEVSPSTASRDDLFLHILYPTESTTTIMPETSLISSYSGDMEGALIKDPTTPRIVMFSKNSAQIENVIYLADYESTQIGKHLIVDLVPNTIYDIYKNGEKIEEKISSDHGLIHFETSGGFTTL